METSEFYKEYERSIQFPGAKANKTVFAWHESQGTCIGVKAIGFRHGNPNAEADELGLNKDGRSCRGVPASFRPVDNSKKRGIKAIKKSQKRLIIRYI